jgi:hypothetical protein
VALAVRNGEKTHRLQIFCALVLIMSTGVELSPIPTPEAPAQVGASGQAYPTTSWAVGLVVPEGASLQGGGKVRWEGVNNLTAAVTLPNITLPDEIVYAVVSVMTSDGSVLQTAAGIWPNDSSWFAYAWLIPSSTSVPLVYQWVLNGSEPAMAPGANVSISIYQISGSWNLRVTDEETGAGVTQQFPSGIGQSVRVGDQEVFALESYSRSGATFRDMGNLTLTAVYLDGLKVTGGVYAYSDWDPTHNPLFSVGSAGVTPPSFVSLGQAKDGSFVWGYETLWKSPNDTLAIVETLLVLVSVVLGVVGVVLWKTRKKSPYL